MKRKYYRETFTKMILQYCKHEHFVIQLKRRIKDGGGLAECRPHLEGWRGASRVQSPLGNCEDGNVTTQHSQKQRK